MDEQIELPAFNPPDVMNDEAFAPPQRQGTASSKHGSEGGGETCRICRSEGTPEEPLFYPCKCNGSIKFVHQECLMEWLSHSHKKHCELCKTPFRFTKLYDANMPHTLPWSVFVRRACIHVATLFVRACRAALVGFIWLLVLPWLIRWGWRWMFYFADAGWAREPFLRSLQAQQAASHAAGGSNSTNATTSISDSLYAVFENLWESGMSTASTGTETNQTLSQAAEALSSSLKNVTSTSNTTSPSASITFRQDTSILSSWTYLAQLTSDPQKNRVILDVFEGQLITCVVIVGFILVFLIREWVVQQQPLVNLDILNNEQRERERIERETERLRRQVELLNHARERLVTLQEEAQNAGNGGGEDGDDSSISGEEFVGWEQLDSRLDEATALLRSPDRVHNMEQFRAVAHDVLRQMRIAERTGVSITELVENVYQKLATFSDEERQDWEDILVGTLETMNDRRPNGLGPSHGDMATGESTTDADSSDAVVRPQMPNRDVSFLATEVQRSLAESGNDLPGDGEVARFDELQEVETFDLDESEGSTASAANLNASPAAALSPSSDGSWQHLGEAVEEEPLVDHVDIFQHNKDEMPITNAGQDAKTNIRRSDITSRRLAVPEPSEEKEEGAITNQNLLSRLEGDSAEAPGNVDQTAPAGTAADPHTEESPHTNNPFHPDGPAPDSEADEPVEEESLRERVSSVFREEFGLDEIEDTEHLRQTGMAPNGQTAANDGSGSDVVQPRIHDGPPPTMIQRLADYFWGDIRNPGAPEPAIAPAEERVGEGDEVQEAPFVPVQDGVPVVDAAPHNVAAIDRPQNNPEVVAAAQQAGLDAEAIEDAEDLEGIFELIGMQGPLIGLFQTSCFCTVLVTGTVAAAIGLPYVWGKLVLSFLSAPMTLLVKVPLKFASSFADIIIDVALATGGWLLYFSARGNYKLMDWLARWLPGLGSLNVSSYLCNLGEKTGDHASRRLFHVFTTTGVQAEDFQQNWNWVFLSGSIHSHASLKTIESFVSSVLNYTGHGITNVAEALSSGSTSVMFDGVFNTLKQLPGVPAQLLAGLTAIGQYAQPFISNLSSLKTGALTFKSATVYMDPALVYWSTSDRGLAVLTGYLSLAVVAAIYVALDTPITSSQSGQRTEKMIRDTLRQAGGVIKVILIISIEMLAFPLYCGLLLDFAFLPLFQNGSVATRWAFAVRAPWTFCFVHWFVGTCYMFHFALFVGMCRKILRKGVLWFIRDPDDPTFHPVRDVLERNVTTQLRKIAFSALVYGALVILGLGGVIWSTGRIFKGLFPIQWLSTEPVLEFPMDMLLYNFLTPLLIKLFKPSNVVSTMYAWWLRRCARVLRLSHFLFDDRRKDEEGRHVRKTWTSFFLLKKADVVDGVASADGAVTENGEIPEVYFKRNGKYVLTPCNDQYRPPKPGEAFLHSDDKDVYITDKDGKKNEHFAKIYVPPYFRLRVSLFMVCLWLFSAFTGLCVTLVPLVFGRKIFTSLLPAEVKVNDIYAYSLGAYILAAVAFTVFKGTTGARYLRDKAQTVDVKALAGTSTRYTVQVLKCVYVYGFLGVVLPLLFAVFLQFYLILPLHTYLVSSFGPGMNPFNAANQTTYASGNVTVGNITVGYASLSNGSDGSEGASLAKSFAEYAANLSSTANATSNAVQSDKLPSLADHSIHILADYALGLLYVRIAVRLILTTPTSRASQAFRLITANGYLNPNARLATRYFVLPTTLAAMIILLTPLWMAKMFMAAVGFFKDRLPGASIAWELNEATQTLIYRYSYPVAAACACTIAGFSEVGRVLSKWRASVRDEVYLVGERLHNFGEGKPPVGSRSVVRKER